jgi:hypothetical protein
MNVYGEMEVSLQYSWPRHWLEISGQLHAPAALPSAKESPVPIG